MTTTDGQRSTIERAALPLDSRNLYQTVLDYLAHSPTARTLDGHALLYKADIYESAAQDAIQAKLPRERNMDLAVPGTAYCVFPYDVRPERLEWIAVLDGSQQWPPKL